MQKIQVFLRDDQKRALQKLSARTGARQSDLVRQSVDLLLETAGQDDDDWREATQAASGIWKDRSATELAPLREAAKARFGGVYGKS